MTLNVEPAEYQRLLGYPRNAVLSERAGELAEWAREWYQRHGSPWVYERHADPSELLPFTSARLDRTLQQAEASGVVLVAVSAGPQLEAEAQRLWHEEKPDEYFFLEVFGSAVVEHLITIAGAHLCAWAEERAMAVLPHSSPGYDDWDVAEQRRLLELIAPPPPARIEVLESGALRPKKSQLAVFGLTRHTDRVRRLTELVPCENCSFGPCQFRRAPYRRNTPASATNLKALKRWAAERLTLEARPDGVIDARFRYDGTTCTTCTNMGRPLAFDYRVQLGPRDDGYPIREQCCEPAPGDTGHTSMCQYIANPAQLMAAIEREKPLLGRPLNDVLSWRRPLSPAGCYCEPESRNHKWGLVLETIHYALSRNGNS
ncbi:conserved hypothetical protein [Candidatus Sulfopaludibacter sp. SbA4]|nr:conserved hypothetical protein [Candidatus Sulfopaludibacter sp. SbA4]